MTLARYSTRLLLVLLSILWLSGCMTASNTVRNIHRSVTTLSNHASAKAAMDQGDLDAAQQFLTGMAYRHQYWQVQGQESWGHLRYRAARIIVSANNKGQVVDPPALCLAYITLFESNEGLPDDPERMLDYMHQAIRMLQTNPRLLDRANPDSRGAVFSQTTLEYYVLWQYLSDGGSIDWTLPESTEVSTIAGISYDVWFSRFKQAIHGHGEALLEPFATYGRRQFIHDAVDFSQFPVFVCVARRKGWALIPPVGHQYDNFRGGGAFDAAHCGQDQPVLPAP